MANDHLTNPSYLTSVAARAWREEPELHEVGVTACRTLHDRN